MKKIACCLSLSVILTISALAQQTLTYEENAYLDADNQPFIIANNMTEGEAGPNQIWDFSTLTKNGEITSYMFSTKGTANAALYAQANMIVRENNMNFYFKVSPTGMEEFGNGNDNYSIIYDQPIVKFPFPFTYGSSISGTYSGKIVGVGSGLISGKYSSIADGYGTLILPGNIRINDVLRVRSMRNIGNSTKETITYRWYAKNSDPVLRYPLLSITTSEDGSHSNVYRVAYYANAAGLATGQAADTAANIEYISDKSIWYKVKLTPNPFIDIAKFEYSLPADAKVNIQVYDNLGRLIETLVDNKVTAGSYSVNFTGTGQFVYFIKMMVNNEAICCKKLIQLK